MTETLGISPREVSVRLKALSDTGKFPNGALTAEACAVLLCACIGPGSDGASPSDLPLSGAATFTEAFEGVGIIDHAHPLFEAIDVTFSAFIANIIEACAADSSNERVIVENVTASYGGSEKTASVLIRGMIRQGEGGFVWLSYGDKILARTLAEPSNPPHMKTTKTIGGQIFNQLGALLAGRSIWDVPGVCIPSATSGAQ